MKELPTGFIILHDESSTPVRVAVDHISKYGGALNRQHSASFVTIDDVHMLVKETPQEIDRLITDCDMAIQEDA